MGLYGRFVYPHVNALMNRYASSIPQLVETVNRLVGQAEGTVLEIGVGSGGCLPLYDVGKVKKVYGLDPHPGLIKMAKRAAEKVKVEVDLLTESAEAISLDENSVDTVLSTFTFCTIPDLPRALGEMHRVLRPGGRIIFYEHGLSPDPSVQRWQRFEEPFHRWLFQGCHMTREIPRTIEEARFKILEMETEYVPGIPKTWAYSWRGTAVRQ